jgi:PAS domain S-box-containing protein
MAESVPAANPRVVVALRGVARVACVAAIAVGLSAVAGWLFDVHALRSLGPSLPSMKANAAIGIVFAGLALLQRIELKLPVIRYRMAIACAVFVVLIGAASLVESFTSLDLHVDELLVRDSLNGGGSPGRMVRVTAVGLTLTGLAILSLDARPTWRMPLAHWFAAPVLVLSTLTLLGYLYGLQTLHAVPSFATVSLPSAMTLAVLGIALFLARPDRGFMAIVSSNTASGIAGRRLLPALIIVPIFIGWLKLLGLRAGIYDTQFGLVLVTTATITLFVTFGLWTVRGTIRHENSRLLSLRDTAAQESRLREADHFRSFIEHMPVGVSILRDDRIVYVNPTMARMLGHDDSDALVGHPAVDHFVHPDDRDAARERMSAAAAEGVGPRRTRCLRRDGSTLVLESTALPFEFEGVPSIISASRDMTEEIAAEGVRRESTAALETFRLMVESIGDYAIFQLDPEGRVRTWNAGARAIKGYEATEIVGSHLSRFYAEEDQPNAQLGLELAAFSGRHEEEGWRVRKDGSRFWAGVVITALREPRSGVSGFVKVTRDLSERKRAEDAKSAALAEKTALLQEVHHRVKNNLQVISSLLKLHGDQITDPVAQSVFADSQDRVRSIALLHEKLYQSKDLGSVNAAEYTESLVLTLMRTHGTVQPARVTIDAPGVSLPIDVALPYGIILNELITNALKHAFPPERERSPEIHIAVSAGDGDLMLVVNDNGVGLPADFDLAKCQTLGMHLVRTLARQLRASVEMTTEHGTHWTFRFARQPGAEA